MVYTLHTTSVSILPVLPGKDLFSTSVSLRTMIVLATKASYSGTARGVTNSSEGSFLILKDSSSSQAMSTHPWELPGSWELSPVEIELVDFLTLEIFEGLDFTMILKNPGATRTRRYRDDSRVLTTVTSNSHARPMTSKISFLGTMKFMLKFNVTRHHWQTFFQRRHVFKFENLIWNSIEYRLVHS